ncbi:MAG: phosphate ABC transporter substrate-binding protein PstS [Prochloraceae cyanobacterium]
MRSLKKTKKRIWLAPLLAVSLLTLTSCAGNQTSETGETEESVKKAPPTTENVSITGAGASFPAPLYVRWFSEYNKLYPNIKISYQSVGSGAGVEQFTKEIPFFAASDVAMTDEEIAKVGRGVQLLPMTAGSIVLAYNVPGVESGLKLSRDVYVDIFLGKITRWNDPRIEEDNPEVDLPNQNITVIHRSDGSGTTGVFTKHLSAISPSWEEEVGQGKTVQWKRGVGAKGNEGVTAQLKQTEGAIGYVEYAYAKQQKIPFAALENKTGNFIEATQESASATLAAVELPENLRAFITDPEGENSYPIVTYTWILAYEEYPDAEKLKAFKGAIKWSLEDGQKISEQLGYIPLPPNVVEKVEAALEEIKVAE